MSHDEFHHSSHLLRQREWKQNDDHYWPQPRAFGPVPGTPPPLASELGEAITSSERTCQRAIMSFKTSATLLRTLFPSGSYRFKKRDTVALASFRLHTIRKLSESGGSDRHMLGLYIHDVVYTRSDGSTVEGTYIPMLLQDPVNPAVSEPEALPMVYSDIEIHDQNERITVETRLCGAAWGRMEWDSLVAREGNYNEELEGEALLLHKYYPANSPQDQKTRLDAGYAAYLESGSGVDKKSIRQGRTSSGNSSFHFDAYDWKRLPTLHHIVSRLTELPVFEVVEASVVDNVGVPDFNTVGRIE